MKFKLSNKNNQYYAIFKVDQQSLPEGVTLKPDSGKIMPAGEFDLEVEFSHQTKIEHINKEIYIFVRGSRKIRLIFNAKTILPDI